MCLATHIPSDTDVAIKVINKSNIKCTDDYTRIVREVNTLKLVNHPNIVKFFEVIDTSTNIYIVTEYVKNG